MKYDLLFDVTVSGYRNWTFAAGGLVFVAIGVLLVAIRRHLPAMFPGGRSPRVAAAFAYGWLAFSLLWTAVTFTVTRRDYSTLRDALVNGEVEVVEGRARGFVPMPPGGHGEERFTVCGVAFSYSDYLVTAGFNDTSGDRGPIREGSWLRLSHVGNRIARLEVAREDPGRDATCHVRPAR